MSIRIGSEIRVATTTTTRTTGGVAPTHPAPKKLTSSLGASWRTRLSSAARTH